jgi:tyrosine phenol-lyase
MQIQLRNKKTIPIEMHRVRIVQSMRLLPVDTRLEVLRGAGFNTFCLANR